jgi:HAD superfamily hydrolase (TIGR01509 family)
MEFILPQAILFDMDGTLTAPILDFELIRKDMGISGQPILEALARMGDEQRKVAEAALHRHEDRAALESTLNPGCSELLEWLKVAKVETAVVTRNSRRSVATVFERHGLHFDVCVTREDGKFKPDPAPLQLACGRLGVNAENTWMVGDGSHDVHAGIAAGIRTVWLSHSRDRDFPGEPWMVVRDLLELTDVLKRGTR